MNISRVHRLLQLITMLQGRTAYTAGKLAEQLGVSKRTVFRDLNMLEMAHVPYYFNKETGGYSINRHFFLPPVNLTIAEALAVLVLVGSGKASPDIPLLNKSTMAAVKIENALPATISQHLGDVLENMHMSLGPMADHEGLDDMFEQISHACTKHKTCEIKYGSVYEDAVIETAIDPLKLVFLSRAWYVIAWSHMHREIRTFKLVRIESLHVTSTVSHNHSDVDIDNHFGLAWQMIPEGRQYDVHLRFLPRVARNIAEVQWHKTQQHTFNEDGSLDFRATVDGIGEISWWIMGYGDQVQVLSPDPLKERIADTAAKMLSMHRDEKRQK